MSSGVQGNRAELLGELKRELRQLHGLGASYFQAAAARIGMNVTDMQVIDLLQSSGPSTAGQLAELTGLTTGAITGLLNRLEEARLVRRERDPADGRRVIVQLAQDKDDRRGFGSLFASLETAWDELASQYDQEQIAVLLAFLKRSNALSRQEIVRLREAPAGAGGNVSAPLGDLESGRLLVYCDTSRLTVRAGDAMSDLYQARFEGSLPDVKVKNGVVTIRYPRRLWVLGKAQRAAEVSLSPTIPWRIMIQGQAAEIAALLDGLDLAGLEVKGGSSMIRLDLPTPEGIVPIRISGGTSEIAVRRPAGVAARLHMKGWGSAVEFDGQTSGGVGNDVRLQSPGYETMAARYDIDVAGVANMVRITSG